MLVYVVRFFSPSWSTTPHAPRTMHHALYRPLVVGRVHVGATGLELAERLRVPRIRRGVGRRAPGLQVRCYGEITSITFLKSLMIDPHDFTTRTPAWSQRRGR